jgi:hypothetical protein
MKEHLTMQQLEDLGFEIIKSYPHDDFLTQRRVKGILQVETTWQFLKGNCVSQDLNIDEVNSINFTLHELNVLDLILNNK